MDKSELAKLIEALKKGQVTVTFKKVDTGEIRVMPCTLNPLVLEAVGTTQVKNVSDTCEHVPCWALDKEAWRSFKVDTVLSWEVNGE
mgnify:FL=1